MDENAHKLDNIILKINTLMGRYIDLEAKHIKVLEENQLLKNEVSKQKEEAINLNNKLKDLNLANKINSNKQGNAALKTRINEFVKEIDKCMAMLNH